MLLLLSTLAIAELPGTELLGKGQMDRLIERVGIESADQLPSYQLDLSLSDAEGRYTGRSTVTWVNNTGKPVIEVPFLLLSNRSEQGGGTLQVTGATVTRGPVGTWKSELPTEGVLALSLPLGPGETLVAELEFGGTLRRIPASSNDMLGQLGGMESGDYGLLAEGEGLITVALAYPQLAPFSGGEARTGGGGGVGDVGWNEVSAFDVRIVTPEGMRVVTNLVDQPAKPLGKGVQVTVAAGVGVREFVFCASRDFRMAEQVVGGVTMRSWFLEKDREAGLASLHDAAATVRFLDDTLGDFPFTELDLVEASLVGGAGGMEFSGLVLIGAFLYRDPAAAGSPMAAQLNMLGQLSGAADSGLSARLDDTLESSRRFTVAHEVAHQYSPALLGTDAWQDPIIDEPLAQYLAARAVEQMGTGGSTAQELEQGALVNYAAFRLLGGADGAADRSTDQFAANLEYAALVYGKAPYFYVALEDDVGRAKLDRALKGAIAKHAWGVVDSETWVSSLEKSGAKGAKKHADRWWKGAHGDEDLQLDAEGHRALELMLGPELAVQLEQTMALLGTTPAQLFGELVPGGIPTGGAPATTPEVSPEQMLELLDKRP